jgi:hypothetical protein
VSGTGALTYNGFNFEFSWNSAHGDPDRNTHEIRPIIGWHLGPYDIIVNPILDNSWKGFSRLDFGPLRGFYPASQQQQQLFGVFDYSGKPSSVEGGVGVGLTGATDHRVLKLILSRDLN